MSQKRRPCASPSQTGRSNEQTCTIGTSHHPSQPSQTERFPHHGGQGNFLSPTPFHPHVVGHHFGSRLVDRHDGNHGWIQTDIHRILEFTGRKFAHHHRQSQRPGKSRTRADRKSERNHDR